MTTTPAKNAVFEQLVHPLGGERFFEEHWPSEPFVHHGALERLGFLADMPEVGELARLCKTWHGPLQAWPKPGTAKEVCEATPANAEALYRDGYTLFFTHIERVLPSVRKVFNRFAAEVGVDPADVNCEAFFSHEGSGAAPHFDGNWGFNVQLRGTKTWTVAPNEHVTSPDIGHAMGAKPDARLVPHATLPFPRAMPPSARSFEAREGTVIFVPSAWWHTTTVKEKSAAVVFTIQPRRWASRVAQELEDRLRACLAVARGAPLLGAKPLRARQKDELRQVLDQLRKTVDELDEDALLETWCAVYDATFALPPDTRVEVEERPGPAWGLVVEQRTKRFEAAIEKSTGDVLRWAASRRAGFALAELCDAFPKRESSELVARIDDLERARLLTRTPARAAS